MKNKPPTITLDNLKSKQLKLSAIEMLCFTRYLCVIIGNRIPQNNRLLTCKRFSLEWCDILKQLITKHHTLLLNIYNEGLKPKFHFLLHYPDIIRQSGPLVDLWTMRYESKHKALKKFANNVSGRTNKCRSIAIKHQLCSSHIVLLSKGFCTHVEMGKTIILTTYNLHKDIVSDLKNTEFIVNDTFTKTTFVKVSDITTREKTFIAVDVSLKKTIFGEIKHIIVNVSNDICFIYKKFITVQFNYHFSKLFH